MRLDPAFAVFDVVRLQIVSLEYWLFQKKLAYSLPYALRCLSTSPWRANLTPYCSMVYATMPSQHQLCIDGEPALSGRPNLACASDGGSAFTDAVQPEP